MQANVYIVGNSAIDIVRRIRTAGMNDLLSPCDLRALDDCAYSNASIQNALLGMDPSSRSLLPENVGTVGNPLHIAVPDASIRTSAAGIVSQVIGGAPVPRTFFRLTENVFVLTPQACFAQIAPKLSIPRRVLLAMEFAGSYSFSPVSGEYVYDIDEVLAFDDLIDYCSQLPHSRGTKLGVAIGSLRWAAENSASPMESAVTILLVLPYRYGGYGIVVPHLNVAFNDAGEIVPPETEGSFKPDISWFDPETGPILALEYNSREYHCGIDDYEFDSDRRERLEAIGFKVIPVSRKKAYDPERFHELAVEVAKMTGKTLVLPADFVSKRNALRAEVLPHRRRNTR